MKWNNTKDNPPPKDGTPIIAWNGDWTVKGWECLWPEVISFRKYHPNAPGNACWRTANGNKRMGDPNFWLPLSILEGSDE